VWTALLVGHETMSATRWTGLALIWLALVSFSADAGAPRTRPSAPRVGIGAARIEKIRQLPQR
jgi:hypothetical protein